MNFLELKTINGNKSLVNMDKVENITDNNNGGCFLWFSGNQRFDVENSYEEIKNMLRKAGA